MAANDVGTIVGTGRLAWPHGLDGCPASKPVCGLATLRRRPAIEADGTLAVTETQAITFTSTYQQGYRLVPLDRATGASNVSVAEVTNGQTLPYTRGTGQPNTYSATPPSGGLQIDWWFSPTPTTAATVTRQFVLRYTVTGAIRIYDAGDQLQWRAIYADRDGAVAASTVTVHLPGDASADTVRSAWYRYPSGGSIGALPQAATGTLSDARSVQFTIGQLPTREGAEVRVQFPHGLVPASPPPGQAQADRADRLQQTVAPIGVFLSLLLTLGILAGGGAIRMLLRFSTGRDPVVGAVPPRLTEPPSDLPAPLAGILVDEVASERQVVAALVDLADRGLVHMADEQNPELLGSKQDVRVTLAAALDDVRLRSYERVLLAAFFGPSPAQPVDVLLSSVNQQFMAAIPTIESHLYEAVARQGLFIRNPETTRRRYRAIGIGLSVAGLVQFA